MHTSIRLWTARFMSSKFIHVFSQKKSLSMFFFSRQLHRHGYCLLGSFLKHLFQSYLYFEPYNYLPKFCLIAVSFISVLFTLPWPCRFIFCLCTRLRLRRHQLTSAFLPQTSPGTVLLAMLSSTGIYYTCSKCTLYWRKVCFTFPKHLKFHETRCVSAKGDDTSECEKFAKYYRSLCPAEWVSAFTSCGYTVLVFYRHHYHYFQLQKQYILNYDFKQCGLCFQ
jgi:hypothetical protein